MAMEMTVSTSASRTPRTPVDSRPAKTRTSSTGKRMQRPSEEVKSTSLAVVHRPTPMMESPSSSFMAILPARFTCTKSESLLRRTPQERGDGLARLDRQKIDEGLAARSRRTQRQAPDLELVDLAARREEQHRRM